MKKVLGYCLIALPPILLIMLGLYLDWRATVTFIGMALVFLASAVVIFKGLGMIEE